MVAALTTPYRLRHPNVQFTIYSRTSTEILDLLDNLEIDAAVTYVDLEPLTRVTSIPLYRERYQLLVADNSPFAREREVTWAQICELPLCLLTAETQNRRMIESLLRGAGGDPRVTVEADSMMVLFAHVRTGSWASVIPETMLKSAGMGAEFAAVPIVDPEGGHTIGPVMPLRDPTTPLATALAAEARRARAILMH